MPESVENGTLPDGELTAEERRALRRIIRDDDRSRWFWREVRRWGAYGAVAVTSVYASWDFIIKLFHGIASAFRGPT